MAPVTIASNYSEFLVRIIIYDHVVPTVEAFDCRGSFFDACWLPSFMSKSCWPKLKLTLHDLRFTCPRKCERSRQRMHREATTGDQVFPGFAGSECKRLTTGTLVGDQPVDLTEFRSLMASLQVVRLLHALMCSPLESFMLCLFVQHVRLPKSEFARCGTVVPLPRLNHMRFSCDCSAGWRRCGTELVNACQPRFHLVLGHRGRASEPWQFNRETTVPQGRTWCQNGSVFSRSAGA